MKIIKRGHPPDLTVVRGECAKCKCVFECTKAELDGAGGIKCPTCGNAVYPKVVLK